jgi:hypothetical protein
VNGIRNDEQHVKDHPERRTRTELDAMGFVWDDYERRWEEVRSALLAYHEVLGDLEGMPQYI